MRPGSTSFTTATYGRALWRALACGALALTLTACGGADQAEEPSPTPAPATATATASVAPTLAPEAFTIYVVEAGDTAWAIAGEHGVTLAELAVANQMTEAELASLAIGQELRIPR